MENGGGREEKRGGEKVKRKQKKKKRKGERKGNDGLFNRRSMKRVRGIKGPMERR